MKMEENELVNKCDIHNNENMWKMAWMGKIPLLLPSSRPERARANRVDHEQTAPDGAV